jgi:crotonobetaine/carnitine-CoA ligase
MSAARAPLEVISSYPAHDGTLWSMLASRATAAADREFLAYESESLTYPRVTQDAARAAALFAARGVRAGDRVGVMSRNHPSTVVTLLALARLGAIMVPVNPEYGIEEAGYVLAHAQVCGVLCAPSVLDVVRAASARLDPAPWLMLNARTDAPPRDPVLPVFADALDAAPAELPPAAGTPDSICVFIYTSGTTGFPKGVTHSQRNVLLAGEGFVERMQLQPDDRLLCILPLFHINALFYSLAGTLAAGATLILVPKFSASTFWKTVAETRATEVNTIAAVTSILTQRPRSEFVADHGLRKVYGAPFTAESYRIFQAEFGVPHLVEGYGMSEIPGVLNNPFHGPHKIGSMGRPSRHPDHGMAFAEMKVVDDAGQELPDGETGELAVRTPIVMKGYYRDPKQTAAAFRDGWFLTGDLGYRDGDGYFWFVARKKDIIRKRGENISGAELDRVIGAHPDVAEVAAIPVPDPLGEDEILVAIVRVPGTVLTARDIAEWCATRLAAIKVPRYVAFVDALPHTPTHRIAKYRLRADSALRDNAVDLKEGAGQ